MTYVPLSFIADAVTRIKYTEHKAYDNFKCICVHSFLSVSSIIITMTLTQLLSMNSASWIVINLFIVLAVDITFYAAASFAIVSFARVHYTRMPALAGNPPKIYEWILGFDILEVYVKSLQVN